ncbi:MAG: Crp/Fnr family transcriptional regulator [Desulfobacterales bacterium]
MLDTLPKADLFRGLAADQYREVIDSGKKTQLPPHEKLFQQGDPATHCYLVNRSRLKLTKLNEQGKEVIIRYVGAGELTAAVAVLKHGTFPVSAESVRETEIIGWDHRTMMTLMHRFPTMAINLLKIILLRIDDLQQRYLEVCTERVDQRIARSLLRLMRWAGTKQGAGILIDFPISRQNIADYSGTTLYTVSRTLSAWEKKGWVQSGRERIVVTDPHALVTFAEMG